MSDFETRLRDGLVALAEEAVPEYTTELDSLPRAQVEQLRSRRSFAPVKILAVAAVILALVALVGGLLATRRDDRTHVQTPSPAWKLLPRSPLSPRLQQATVFTGRAVLIWGGRTQTFGTSTTTPAAPSAGRGSATNDGARYDIATSTWHTMHASPLSSRHSAVSAWTGKEMLVVGGVVYGAGDTQFARDGAAYDPANDRWRRIADAPACPLMGAWTTTRLVVGGTCNDGKSLFSMASYDPAANRWTAIAPPHLNVSQLVASGNKVVAFDAGTERAAQLDATNGTWTALPALAVDHGSETSTQIAGGPHGELAIIRQPANPMRGEFTEVWSYDARSESWQRHGLRIMAPSTPSLGSPGVEQPVVFAGVYFWQSDDEGYGVYDPATGRAVEIDNGHGPFPFAFHGASLVPIGDRSFFVWGGQYGTLPTAHSNEPSAEGGIVTIPGTLGP